MRLRSAMPMTVVIMPGSVAMIANVTLAVLVLVGIYVPAMMIVVPVGGTLNAMLVMVVMMVLRPLIAMVVTTVAMVPIRLGCGRAD